MFRNRTPMLLPLVMALAGCSRKTAVPQSELERKFEEMMNGATLSGRSTRLADDRVATGEKYEIQSVSKVAGDTWLFRTRFQCCGQKDVVVPLPVTIKWAGDTPVITLTDLAIPGMGTYTARVLLYRDQYAGTWSGKNGGGQIFGAITRGGAK